MLGYHTEPILLYQDMTSRDLLQQRTTLANGDTAWRPSPLIEALTHGHIAILDGLHRINGGTFSVLARLVMFMNTISLIFGMLHEFAAKKRFH